MGLDRHGRKSYEYVSLAAHVQQLRWRPEHPGRGAGRRDIVTPTAEGISEFTGVVFSPDAKTLFFHSQEPGITYAVTGPFARINRAK